jgi:serine/threonine protein kinase
MSGTVTNPLKTWLTNANGAELQMTVMETARGDLQGLFSSQLDAVPDAIIIPILFKIYWSIMCAQRCIPGFRHNDLKPDNILLLPSCERTPDIFRMDRTQNPFVFKSSGDQPIIIDFGWSYYDSIPGGFRPPTRPGQTTCGMSPDRDYYYDVFTFVRRFMRTPSLANKVSPLIREHFSRLVNPIFFQHTISTSINTLDRFDLGAFTQRYGPDDPCVQFYSAQRLHVNYIHDVVLQDPLFYPYRQSQVAVDGRVWTLPGFHQ